MSRYASNRHVGVTGWLKEMLYKIMRRPGYEPIGSYLRSRREHHSRMLL